MSRKWWEDYTGGKLNSSLDTSELYKELRNKIASGYSPMTGNISQDHGPVTDPWSSRIANDGSFEDLEVTGELTVNGQSMETLIKDVALIKERLLILEPDFNDIKQYSALKAAYEQYKIVEALMKTDAKAKRNVE